jgi:glutamate synthase (ferredoxin)
MNQHHDAGSPAHHATPLSDEDRRRSHFSSAYPLYDPSFEHDACGTGLVANIDGTSDKRVLSYALEALANLAHRGAMDAAAETSEGAGIMAALPWRIITDWLAEQGIAPELATNLAVGMCFLPPDRATHDEIHLVIGEVIARHGMRLLGWRAVPVTTTLLSARAQADCPVIEQAIIAHDHRDMQAAETRLFIARHEIEQRLAAQVPAGFAIPSFSARTVVYKGLLTAEQVPLFYPDLRDPRYTTSFAIFHQRYSTNTFPSWRLAQPFRFLAHNGEINTVQGNRISMAARETEALHRRWPDDAQWLHPIIQAGGSDSASLDNVLELMQRSGYDMLRALAILVPEAWEGRDDLPTDLRAFYAAYAPMMEPWDGPAALIFSDGQVVGAKLDRNGLRPLRYTVTAEGLLVVASETGVLDASEHTPIAKGRLGPGQMIAVDLVRGGLLVDSTIKAALAANQPYAAWVRDHHVAIAPPATARVAAVPDDLVATQARFGYSYEDMELVIRPMAVGTGEAIMSMGDDTPLAVLSQQPRAISSYFKQRFAQVTNPPIDALRERSVMSLTTYLGPRGNVFAGNAPCDTLLVLPSPILDEAYLAQVLHTTQHQQMHPVTLVCAYVADDCPDGVALASALESLAERAVEAVQQGAGVVVLADREIPAGQAPMPMLLALAATHQALLRHGLRARVGLVAATGAVCDTQQLALLIGFGANAVCPYLALASARAFAGARGLEDLTPAAAQQNLCGALEKGLLKIMARMGLSTLENYHGAQLFEAIGLEQDLIARYFPGTPSSLGGFGLREIHTLVLAQEVDSARLRQRDQDSDSGPRLLDRGYIRFRRTGEYHAANPAVVKALQRAARSGTAADYARYTELIYARPPMAIRDHLTFTVGTAIPLDEVEPATAIVRRFASSAMSLGSLSPEAHLTLTLGMNRLGGRSNTGEGGEAEENFFGHQDGVPMNSRIKQIASGRFGVTAAYLAHAEELEIKMAQGSKPGEGGQIPARKVTELIARLRHTTPGIPLISPPPHHDIYSIEDLAQLIFDLKQTNPRAAIGVKLVATRGVGTIAAGVAKAHANYILISGHDGGTGSSPLSSIKNVGSPWELGLAEAQQVLRLNGLRGRVRLRVDGNLKTGRDIVVAAMLGADEFGFATAALIALGCDMARQCHLDTCPAGIATQRADLRQKFTGTPEHIANFFLLLAEEVRTILASLGARSLQEVIGRTDLLNPLRGAASVRLALSALLAAGPDDGPRRHTPATTATDLLPALPEASLLDDALPLLERGHGVLLHAPISNRDRTVGARLAGEIAWRWGDAGLPKGSITCHYTGSAGQSFGAFCVPGLRLILVGDANDYVAKGMTGGEIVISPPHHRPFAAHTQTIAGNTVLYGATGGLLLMQGCAGERFAVRNSGAVAVVEGVGDHGCEYMTGGAVIILGPTGRNFGAGMSGGVAYVYDPEQQFPARCNAETLHLERRLPADEAHDIAALLRHYVSMTASPYAANLLADWPTACDDFWRVLPQDHAAVQRPLQAYVAQLATKPMAVPA